MTRKGKKQLSHLKKKTYGPENQRMAAGKENIKDKQTNKQTNKTKQKEPQLTLALLNH